MKNIQRLIFPPDMMKNKLIRVRTEFYEKVLPNVLRRREVVYYLYELAMRPRHTVGKLIPPFLLDERLTAREMGIPSLL